NRAEGLVYHSGCAAQAGSGRRSTRVVSYKAEHLMCSPCPRSHAPGVLLCAHHTTRPSQRNTAVFDTATAAPLLDPSAEALAPARLAELARAGALPPEALPAACERLRSELRAIASYVPETLLRQQI